MLHFAFILNRRPESELKVFRESLPATSTEFGVQMQWAECKKIFTVKYLYWKYLYRFWHQPKYHLTEEISECGSSFFSHFVTVFDVILKLTVHPVHLYPLSSQSLG